MIRGKFSTAKPSRNIIRNDNGHFRVQGSPPVSQLILSADADALADRLLAEIAAQRAAADPFEPISIVVPNRFVQQWLKFRMARTWGVAANLQFTFLEQALWDGLRELDPRPHAQPPELLDDERYHLLALSILWNDDDRALAPLQDYFELGTHSRLGCRRAWQLAGQLATLIRDYEYHRQDAIIHRWLTPRLEVEVPAAWREREAAQRAVFRRVTDEKNGRRALLNRKLKRNLKTLPQYVMELIHEVPEPRLPKPRLMHLFGLSQISPLHLRGLELLGRFHEFRIYHLNPLASRIVGPPTQMSLNDLAAAFRADERPDLRPGTELLHIWGRAGVESLHLTADFLNDSNMTAVHLRPRTDDREETVLRTIQAFIRGAASDHSSLPQDDSLQIVRCPGIWREAETIHAGIVNVLQKNPQLQQTDIAVLVTDMNLYRPVLTAVFDRPPRRLSFGLADYSAARVSMFGQAVVGMLDLALENLSRTRVFEVLLNPCVLARFKIDREAALHWLKWAESLGIYHGWDAAEKNAQGYVGSQNFSWKLGLQRLRLGHYMDVALEDGAGPAPEWQGVIPFADVESGDRQQLDQFSRLVEGLLPMLVRFRGMEATAGEWTEAILEMMRRFIAVPEDRPEEEPVREALIESLNRFAEWDVLHDQPAAVRLPLALVREVVAGRLRDIPGRRNDVLTSGVTIAALQPQRPIPFEVVFLAGMGEKHFPGSAAPGPFDLRQVRRQDGDILPVEQQRFGFLEAILSAKQKLIITYNARDLQKDEELQPAIPVAQLQRFVGTHILTDEFRAVTAPLTAHDAAYLTPSPLPEDVLVHEYEVDRILAIESAVLAGRVTLDAAQREALDLAREKLMPRPANASDEPVEARPTPTVSLKKLSKFLENPAAAALRYHLHADDEWDAGHDDDCEPLTSPKSVGDNLVRQTLVRIVQRAETESVSQLAVEWPEEFERKYREATLRGQLPEGAFAKVDAAVLRRDVEATLNDGGLLAFLKGLEAKTCCGPYLIGESETPIGAKSRVPALTLPLKRPVGPYPSGEMRIVGSWPLAWTDDETLDLLVFPRGEVDRKKPLCRHLFEPMLFAVALAATGALQERRVIFQIVQAGGMLALPLTGPLLEAEAAREYLRELATDFVDVGCADQLPFECVQETGWPPLYSNDDGANLADNLLALWRWREETCNWGFTKTWLNAFTTIGFRVPMDAGEKVRRRFRPLHLLLPLPEEPVPKKPRSSKSPKTKGGGK